MAVTYSNSNPLKPSKASPLKEIKEDEEEMKETLKMQISGDQLLKLEKVLNEEIKLSSRDPFFDTIEQSVHMQK